LTRQRHAETAENGLKQASRDQRTRQKRLVSDRWCTYIHARCQAGTRMPLDLIRCVRSGEPCRCTVRVAPDEVSNLVSADTSYRYPHSSPGPTRQYHSVKVSCQSHESPDDLFRVFFSLLSRHPIRSRRRCCFDFFSGCFWKVLTAKIVTNWSDRSDRAV